MQATFNQRKAAQQHWKPYSTAIFEMSNSEYILVFLDIIGAPKETTEDNTTLINESGPGLSGNQSLSDPTEATHTLLEV
jgi:hypothetical protein